MISRSPFAWQAGAVLESPSTREAFSPRSANRWSIRISDSLREYLERVKDVMSSCRADGVSTSEVAKMVLESAKDDRLDHRLEGASLQGYATESLWSIRQKWEQQQGLSHAEWLFLARSVQVGYGRKATRNRPLMGRKCLAFPVQRGRPDAIAVAAIRASAS